MLPLFFTNTLSGVVFIVACMVWWIPETIGMFRQMAKVSRKSSMVRDRGSMVILLGLQWLGLVLSFLLVLSFQAAAIPWHRTSIFLIGIVFIILGVVLRWYAISTLGRYFTRDVAVSADQEIIQQGPYRYIRHPAYSGTLLTILGLGLAMTNWASLIVLLVCVVAGHLYRVHIEEQALIQTIGEPYVSYMRHTKRFIPFVF